MSIIKIKNQFIDQQSGVSGFVSEDSVVYLNLKGKFVIQENFEFAPHMYGFAMTSTEGIEKIIDIYSNAKKFFEQNETIQTETVSIEEKTEGYHENKENVSTSTPKRKRRLTSKK